MKLHEAQEKGIPKSCVVCGKQYMNPYGRWGEGGTCSKKCEEVRESQPLEKPKEVDNGRS